MSNGSLKKKTCDSRQLELQVEEVKHPTPKELQREARVGVTESLRERNRKWAAWKGDGK
jgi:hypothetical protein